MKIFKVAASLAAAAVAASAMAFSVFAADPVTVTLDENYLGDWKASSGIAREEFDKFDGDVKVVLTVKPENVKDGNSYILKPMDIDKSWDAITASLTTEKGVCKPDGFIQVKADQTEIEFVVPASVKNDLWNTGIAFQCSNVTVKSATLSDGSAENEWTYVSDADTPDYCAGRFDPFAASAEAEETDAEAETTDAAADSGVSIDTVMVIQENATWATTKSDAVTITGAGDYTYTLSGLAIDPATLTVLYIKDASCVDADPAAGYTATIPGGSAVVKSFKINGNDVALSGDSSLYDDSGKIIDMCFFNTWAAKETFFEAPAETIETVEVTISVSASASEAAPAPAVVEEDEDEDVVVEDDADVEVESDEVVEDAAPEVVEEVTLTEAVAVETVPAVDTTATAPVKTGNAAAASIAFVMVAAGAAAVVSKRK